MGESGVGGGGGLLTLLASFLPCMNEEGTREATLRSPATLKICKPHQAFINHGGARQTLWRTPCACTPPSLTIDSTPSSSTAKHIISHTCLASWNTTLRFALRITSLGQCCTDLSRSTPRTRQTFHSLDLALAYITQRTPAPPAPRPRPLLLLVQEH